MLHDLAIHLLENALHVCYEHRSVSISCNVCLPMPRAVKEFLSSRLIMNSRQLWNSHQRHKFLRAEVPRNILKLILVLEMAFPWHDVSSEYRQDWEQCPRDVPSVPQVRSQGLNVS